MEIKKLDQRLISQAATPILKEILKEGKTLLKEMEKGKIDPDFVEIYLENTQFLESILHQVS